jgi:hypothetical protein
MVAVKISPANMATSQGRALAHEDPEVGLEVRGLGRLDGAQLLDGLGLLLLHDVDDVVHRHDAQHLAGGVHHRQGQQAVALEDAGHVLLVHLGRHRDGVGVHHRGDGLAGPRQHQVAQRHRAQQRAVGIDRVGLVDGLLLGGRAADLVDGPLDR